MAAPNPTRQRGARRQLAEVFAQPARCFVVHYACQSFHQPQRYGSPRIASIAVRNLGSGETTSFSLHQEMELLRSRRFSEPGDLDALEQAMLVKYFRFLAEQRHCNFLHWNMRDVKFGFAALEHRMAVLGGRPISLPEHLKLDLSLLIASIYGSSYVAKPYLQNLARANGLSLTSFVSGEDESSLFYRGEFYAVLQSNLCKVALIASVAGLASDRTLVTDANLWTLNFGRVREAVELFDRNPVQALVGLAVAGASAGWSLIWALVK